MAIYAIGDLQGCYDPLMRLLDKVCFDPYQDQLWLAGDLVSRGKQSLDTLRFVHALGDSAISVLGNHDISLIAAFHGLRKAHKSLRRLLEASDSEELVTWLQQQPLLHTDPKLGYALCHAGISPHWDLATAQACAREVEQALRSSNMAEWLSEVYGDQPDTWSKQLKGLDRHRYIINAFTRMRYCRRNGSLEFHEKGSPSYTKKYLASTELMPWFKYPTRCPIELTILFGHWSTLSYYQGNQVIALDTGCVWGGQLSALRIDIKKQERIYIPCNEYG